MYVFTRVFQNAWGDVGCFIFSPFLKFKMPGVPCGGIRLEKMTPKIFALLRHIDVIHGV